MGPHLQPQGWDLPGPVSTAHLPGPGTGCLDPRLVPRKLMAAEVPSIRIRVVTEDRAPGHQTGVPLFHRIRVGQTAQQDEASGAAALWPPRLRRSSETWPHSEGADLRPAPQSLAVFTPSYKPSPHHALASHLMRREETRCLPWKQRHSWERRTELVFVTTEIQSSSPLNLRTWEPLSLVNRCYCLCWAVLSGRLIRDVGPRLPEASCSLSSAKHPPRSALPQAASCAPSKTHAASTGGVGGWGGQG